MSKANKTTVGLVQIGEMNWTRRRRQQWQMKAGIPVPKPGRGTPASFVYVPYSVGLLQAYAQQHVTNPDQVAFLPFIFKPIPVAAAVAQLREADVVGFSTYIWNIRLSLTIARELKKVNPDVLVVFGGPQVPDLPAMLADFLYENPFIDLVCHGEGERVFVEILERHRTRDWTGVPSVSYVNEAGKIVTHSRATRIRDFSTIPSPFLEGTFDEMMTAHQEHRWMVMWETNRGCPFSCSFCDWGSATASKVFRFDMDRLKQEIEWFAQKRIEHLFVCDANFGIFPRDTEIARALVDVNKRHRNPITISVQNTKNATERSYKVQKIFSEITTAGVTLSLQSVDAHTLENIKRDNISLGSFRELQRRYIRDGIGTYTDIILGLPGETYDAFTDGVSQVLQSGQHNRIAFYNCSVLPNAEMGNPAYREKFGMETRPVQIIHEHELLERTEKIEVKEYLDNVVATAAMPGEEWVRAKAFTWIVELLHFNRLFQAVFVLLAETYGVSYKELFEAVLYADEETFPICGEIRETFLAHARRNQAGAPEYVPDEKRLGAWWPMHQHMFIVLAEEGQLDAFYGEVELILAQLLAREAPDFDRRLLHEAIMFNRSLIRMPFTFTDAEMTLSYNIWAFYKGVLEGRDVPLVQQPARYHIDRTSTVWLTWEAWYEDIVLRVYRRDDYLYDVEPLPVDLALQLDERTAEPATTPAGD